MEGTIIVTNFSESNLKYFNLSMSSIKNIEFNECIMIGAGFEEIKLNKVSFENCDLRTAQVFKTSLSKIDFTTSNIEGLTTGLEEIKGAIVTPEQAMDLARLLQITIK